MIHLLTPAYNEAENLKMLIKSVNNALKKDYVLTIVNDGSTDQTPKLVKKLSQKYPVRIVGYKQNKGPGFAFRFGLNLLLKEANKDDVIITLESDNTSDLSVIFKMISLLEKFDVVIAAPSKIKKGFVGVKSHRVFISNLNHHLLKLIFPIRGVESYSNFFRAYKVSILKKAKSIYGDDYITENGFTSVTELLIKLDKIGAKMTSVPARIDWSKRLGKSKMKILKYARRQIVLIIKYKLLPAYFIKSKRL